MLLKPHTESLDRRFERRLQQLRFGPRERSALTAITPCAVASAFLHTKDSAPFFERVEYHGRRLAKMNLPPSVITTALAEYDGLLTPLLDRQFPIESANLQWVREQLHFCVILTLNNAYYQVRESETQAFYELFRVELESRNLDELLHRFLATLAQYCRADAAHLFLAEPDSGAWTHRGSADSERRVKAPDCSSLASDLHRVRSLSTARCWVTKGATRSAHPPVLDGTWLSRFASCWSVPLIAGNRLAGVMQFGFRKQYDWLPREQELLTAAAERCHMAAEKARLVEDLAQREEQVRSLAEHMLHVEEAERRRISRELHDEAGQSLLTIRLQMEMTENTLPEDSATRARLSEVREMTEATILDIRRLIAALSPAVLEQLGLGAALRQLVSRFRRTHPAKVKLHLSRIQNLPKKLEIIVYRLVQECCNNTAKHSQASHVNISATTADGILRLQVADDGIGFQLEEAFNKRNSFGLSGIRERVALMGGRFSIQSQAAAPAAGSPSRSSGRFKVSGTNGRDEKPPWHGTRIRIELPIDPAPMRGLEAAQRRGSSGIGVRDAGDRDVGNKVRGPNSRDPQGARRSKNSTSDE